MTLSALHDEPQDEGEAIVTAGFGVRLVWTVLFLSGATRRQDDIRWAGIVIVSLTVSGLLFFPSLLFIAMAGAGLGAVTPLLVLISTVVLVAPLVVAQLIFRPPLLGHRKTMAMLPVAAPLIGLVMLQGPGGILSMWSPKYLFQSLLWVVIAIPYALTIFHAAARPIGLWVVGLACLIFTFAWMPAAYLEMQRFGTVRGLFWPVETVLQFDSPAMRDARKNEINRAILTGQPVSIGNNQYAMKGAVPSLFAIDKHERRSSRVTEGSLNVSATEFGLEGVPPGKKFSLRFWSAAAHDSKICEPGEAQRRHLQKRDSMFCDADFLYRDLYISVREPDVVSLSDEEIKQKVTSWLDQHLIQ